ncbi:hypothetical protein ACVRZG_02670 [Streptococcus hyovaginalis]|uniref:hypothetical protein n=1 Tax=Streptococcus hyovaginalis TaxID=149015 RepID=UPI000406A2C0|nr:hypothetical protein [Streptococcus hyovaginalis]QBX25457.1 hypothetical protein Javan258_0050 [Streptococcus phage Javan258]
MPNWAEGTIKLRGRAENIASALKHMLVDETVTVEEEYDGELIKLNTTQSYFYIKGTRRAFIESNSLELWLDDDFLIVELGNFKQAWAAIPDNYQDISKQFDVDIKIFTFEQGYEFTQEIEISKGNVIKDIVNEKFDNYQWDVPFSKLGG